jgi:uncharacterized protein (TIGR02246 family)
MKRIFIFLAMIIAATTFVFGQSKNEQEIRKMFEMTANALVKNDLAALSNYYADDLTMTLADGRTGNKTQFLDFVKNSKRESFNFDDVSVRTFGDTAVVNFNRTSTNITPDGTKSKSKSRDTATLVKNGKGWQIVALQISNEQAGNQADGNAEQEIRKTLNTIADALVKNDVATLSNHYADSYTFIGSNGEVVNKTQRLERAKNARFQTFSYEDLNIRQMGDAAVVIARPAQTIKLENGEMRNLQDRATLTMAKMNGRWQIVATQVTSYNPSSGNQAETEKQIGEIMTIWGNAAGRRDTAAVEKILPADFMLVSPDGKLSATRAEYLEVVKSFPTDATVTGKAEKTIVSGDTAVQTGTYSVMPKASGANAANYRFTATFVMRGGRWLPIAFNSRAIEQK